MVDMVRWKESFSVMQSEGGKGFIMGDKTVILTAVGGLKLQMQACMQQVLKRSNQAMCRRVVTMRLATEL